MVPASGWGLLSLPPAACASIHQPLLYTTGVQAVPRERESVACLDATSSGIAAQAGRQDVVGLPALAAPKPCILQVSWLNRVSSSERGKEGTGTL